MMISVLIQAIAMGVQAGAASLHHFNFGTVAFSVGGMLL
jgi:hypothetical protein